MVGKDNRADREIVVQLGQRERRPISISAYDHQAKRKAVAAQPVLADRHARLF